MADLFSTLLKEADNEYASIVDDGVIAGDVNNYISTGSFSFNALLSGSIFGGLPGNKVTALAGEPSTGKTFYVLALIRQFLIDNPNGFVFFFASESDVSKDTMQARGIDTKRVVVLPVVTVQEFRTQAVRILDKYEEDKSKDKPPIFFVLDSLGNLSTTKEIADITAGAETRDMTRAQLIRGAFRVLTLKLGRANVPLVVTNHVYDVVGSYVPMKKMGGGSGLEYAASTIIFFTKKKLEKEKSTGDVPGVIITATTKKSRLTRENKKVETLLSYDSGLDPYYGLVDLAVKFGIFKKVSTKIAYGEKWSAFESHIEDDPAKYFTQEVLEAIDEACKQEFLYGNTSVTDEKEE